MCEYERVIRNELAYWPGVDVEFGRRAKHRQATFHRHGETRFLVFPDSPSDSRRGALNCVAAMRKELAELGAQRLERKPKPRNRKNRVVGRQMPNRPGWASRIELAPVKTNPFDALAHLAPVAQWTEQEHPRLTAAGSTPARRSIWQRLISFWQR